MSQFFLWRGGKGSRMVSFMYQSVIQHLWLMDSISEHIDVALYTEGQIRSNKAWTALQRNTAMSWYFMIFQHWSIIPTIDLETHWSGRSQFFLWSGGKGSRMVSFMYQSVIQHLWLMDSISEHIDVALYTEGQIRSNKALTTLKRNTAMSCYFMIFQHWSIIPTVDLETLDHYKKWRCWRVWRMMHECIIEYIKFWMILNDFFMGGRYHFRTHFRTQKRNSCQKFWVLRPPL